MQKFWGLLIFCGIVCCLTPAARSDETSALIAQALDKQLPRHHINFNGTLPQAIQEFGDLTGVRIEADPDVYDILPWGDLTTFSARLEHLTLRQALAAICRKLGLEFELQSQVVELRPLPALLRLGRRCTVGELEALDLLSRIPLVPPAPQLEANQLLAAIDDKLEKSAYAVENRAFGSDDHTSVNVARNATLMDALDSISLQTDATWYPWGRTIVVLRKTDNIRLQLSKRISLRFIDIDVSDVLLELAHRSGVAFQIEPGAVQKIPPQFRSVRLTLDDATIQQALESICGFTGLGYSVTDDGVRIWNSSPAVAPASTQPTR